MFDRDRSTDPAKRVYAIGDIHGRYDLFRQLIAEIGRDFARRPATGTRIVLLGDIVDRGPDAARLVRGCMRLTACCDRFTVLKGNHEEMMVQALRGDMDAYRAWLRFGGRETLLSWNVDPEILTETATRNDLRLAANAVGRDVLAWLDRLPLHDRHDDFLFVHAGIRPDIPIGQQDPNDLLWITDDFLTSDRDHAVTVVHGHSIRENGPDVQANRIGIDTGAYRTGHLTAIGIEGDQTWYLDTARDDANVAPARTVGCSAVGDTGTARLDAFDDAQLDAALATILGVPTAARPATLRRRSTPMRLLSSRHASATTGLTLALLGLAGTAFLLNTRNVAPVVHAPTQVTAMAPVAAVRPVPVPPAQIAARSDEVGSPISPGLRPPTPAVRRAARETSVPDLATPPVAVTLVNAAPVAITVPPANPYRDITLSTVDTPIERTVSVDNTDAAEVPSMRARRDSVAALRALRRQW